MVAIYDKAIDQIAGRTKVPEIKEFFWNWRRDHRPVAETNLRREFNNLLRPNETAMQDLGVFGDSFVEELGQTVTGAAADLDSLASSSGFTNDMDQGASRFNQAPGSADSRRDQRSCRCSFSRRYHRIPRPQSYGSLRSRLTAKARPRFR